MQRVYFPVNIKAMAFVYFMNNLGHDPADV